jgi:hypothetical protein
MMRLEVPWEGSEMVVRAAEWNPGTSAWDRWRHREAVTYVLCAAGMRHANEFYVLGYDSVSGHSIVERWDWPSGAGGYVAVREPASQPMGVGYRTPSTAVDLLGDDYIAPLQRIPPPVALRTRLYDGPSLGLVYRICIDPDGRFMLMHRQDSTTGVYDIAQLPLAPGAQPIVLVRSTDAPELVQSVSLVSAQHVRKGRMHIIRAGLWNVWFEDLQNDGIIDHWDHAESADFQDLFPSFGFTAWYP